MDVNHISIILDGNRTWARGKGLDAHLGHREGSKTLEKLAEELNNLGLKYLTVYVFSTENWKRSKFEVDYLMKLFRVYFGKIAKAKDHNIKIKFFSSRKGLDKKLNEMIDKAEEATKDNTGMQLNFCFNYGGRTEILEATEKIIEDVEAGVISKEDINEELYSSYLYSKGVPDPEIIIRTSGEMRLSNFLTWQGTYSELFFVKKTWPDFRIEDLKEVLEEFKKRDRRFGGK